ncbi:hypothetical protein GQ53DRAFT_823162 [Thozetella sp. PMI_491]|nr:hypothetical protein GQ53DRAFT_823162 [Thozetella sp. PMI_491]
MAMHKSSFYSRMRDKIALPIYTLRLPGARMYVVNATSLITYVQWQFRIVNFAHIEVKAAVDIMGASKVAKQILSADMQSDEGYIMSFAKAIHPATSLGLGLDAMSRAAIGSIASVLDMVSEGGTAVVSMFEWLRPELLLATTDAVYGPENPFRDYKVVEACKFEPGIIVLAFKIFPSLLAKESINAREPLVQAIF